MNHEAEEIERQALASLHAAVTPELAASLDISCIEVGGALVSVAGALPDSAVVINRCLGAGLYQDLDTETLSRIHQQYDKAGVGRWFLQLHPDAMKPGAEDMLAGGGMARARGWQKFSRGTAALPDKASNHDIREIDGEHGHAAAVILAHAFDLGLVSAPWIQLLPECENWHVFMGFDNGEPAALGALYIEGDTAWTDFAATDPDFRRRGFQSALLRHRISYALDQGCRHIHTCTGEAVPGDPQHSYTNILKVGFKEEYLRFNYAPAT